MQNRADQRKHHVIYKTTCLATGKWYIGMHSTNDLTDGYIGSGQRLWKSIKKHGREQHLCEIIEHLPDRKSLSDREEEILSKELRADPLCMNLRSGGTGNYPGTPTTEETRAKKSASMKLAWANGMTGSRGQKQKPETIAKRAAAHAGKTRSEEQKANLTAGLLAHYADPANAAKHAKRMSDPEVSAKKRAAMLARFAAETPEAKAARIAKIKAGRTR